MKSGHNITMGTDRVCDAEYNAWCISTVRYRIHQHAGFYGHRENIYDVEYQMSEERSLFINEMSAPVILL